jgi:hypothetical protein
MSAGDQKKGRHLKAVEISNVKAIFHILDEIIFTAALNP